MIILSLSLYQPHYPSGEVWNDAAEAEEWAKLYVASVEDEAAPFAPNKRGEAGIPKPTPEEIKAIKEERMKNIREKNLNRKADI